MSEIKTANERCKATAMLSHHNACIQEIAELRATLAERDAEIERLTKTGALDLQKVASMVDELTILRAALNSAEQSKKQLNKLWVSHHANGTDAAIESCESSITDLRTLIASMEAQPITVFVAMQKKHQKYVKVSHGAMIEEILAVCGTHDAALSVCNAAEEKYHEDFPGYRQYKEEPEHAWEVVEIEADFPLYTRPAQPASEPPCTS